MKRKPRGACSYPMYPELTDGQFCQTHQKLENQRYEKYERHPIVGKRYGSTWWNMRERYVKAHPYCEQCFKVGRMVEVEEVHHQLPLSKGRTHDSDNLILLCQSYHARIHVKDGSRWNRG